MSNGPCFRCSAWGSWSGLLDVSHFGVIAAVKIHGVSSKVIMNAAAGSQKEGKV